MARRIKARALWTNESIPLRVNTESAGAMTVILNTRKLLDQPNATGNAGFSLEHKEVVNLVRAGNEWLRKFDERRKKATLA